MKRWMMAPAAALALVAVFPAGSTSASDASASSPTVRLWKLDCGRLDENQKQPFAWQKVATPTPCFLVQHGNRYLLWDSGISKRAIGANHPTAKLERSIVDQLTQLNIGAEAIQFVGISHYHGDHTGQASSFDKATLLIGRGDMEALKRTPPPGGAAPSHFDPWIKGPSKVDLLDEDRDLFGDGRVMILRTPGHTPGHSSLMVKLKTGTIILTGDLWFSHADALKGTMPDFNTDRSQTLASRERIARLAEVEKAEIIIQHEPADMAKLPAFPTPLE